MTLISDDVGLVRFHSTSFSEVAVYPSGCAGQQIWNKMLKRKRGFFEFTFCLTERLLRTRITGSWIKISAEQNKISIEN